MCARVCRGKVPVNKGDHPQEEVELGNTPTVALGQQEMRPLLRSSGSGGKAAAAVHTYGS